MIDTHKLESVLPPVEKSLIVSLSVEAAFNLFTQGFSTWWPMVTHSVGLAETISCHVEEYVGGRVYEIQKDGSEVLWGTILAWEPPHRFIMSWHPGRDENTAQEVEVRFENEGEGTRLKLIHRGWETLGDEAQKTREGYVSGWDMVLGNYLNQMKTVIANP